MLLRLSGRYQGNSTDGSIARFSHPHFEFRCSVPIREGLEATPTLGAGHCRPAFLRRTTHHPCWLVLSGGPPAKQVLHPGTWSRPVRCSRRADRQTYLHAFHDAGTVPLQLSLAKGVLTCSRRCSVDRAACAIASQDGRLPVPNPCSELQKCRRGNVVPRDSKLFGTAGRIPNNYPVLHCNIVMRLGRGRNVNTRALS